MRFQPSYFIYYYGGAGGNFIASLCIHALSQGQHAPVFDSTGNAHYLYTNHLKQFIPQWPQHDADLINMVGASEDPWLVFCPPCHLRDQMTYECVTDYNLVITSTPDDHLEILFNHYYKNWRGGLMAYSPKELLDVYAAMRDHGELPEIKDWRQLDTYQTMRLLKKYLADRAIFADLERPGDPVIAYRDIHDRPEEVLQTLEEWLGIELPHQIDLVYDQYLVLNRQLRSKYWRP
jgi:hypothetical protein